MTKTHIKIQPGAISKLRDRQEAITRQLLDAIPESLGQWRQEAAGKMIDQLFRTGKSCWMIKRLPIAGFDDLEELKRQFRKLRTAWRGVIKISLTMRLRPDLTIYFHAE